MGFCACFRSDAHACAAVYTDGAQRTQPFSFGGDLRAGTCFVDRNGPFSVYSVFICTYNGFNSAYHADAFHTESAVRCFFEPFGLHPIGQTNLSEWLGTLISQGTGNHRQRKHGIRCQSRSICFFILSSRIICYAKENDWAGICFCCFPLRGGSFFYLPVWAAKTR